MHLSRRAFGLSRVVAGVALGLATFCGEAMAQVPQPWQMGMQAAQSPVEERVQSLHDLLLVIITVITIFVAALLLYVCWRFSSTRHPVPSRVSHNSILEVAWTIIPVLILVVIAIPSFRLIYYEDRATDADLTIKVTGHQWYWQFTYPDQGGVEFSSYVVPSDELKPGQMRLLSVDNQLVVPAGKKIRVLTTSGDVIHSFFIPSLGVQRYAIPGRTIETWFEATNPGDYYGECNQICGTNHSAMPISVHAVTPAEFTTWVAEAKKKFAALPEAPAAPPSGPLRLAQVQP